jgi:[ribosomal protein S5]-alanine N-acetyltransferase
MIETERLILKPLTLNQLKEYILNDGSLEKELNVKNFKRPISPELQEAIEQTIIPNVSNLSNNYLFTTLWTLISKEENCMVGDLCLVGSPIQNGSIEIGYGTYEHFQNQGFMTEAVEGIIQWASLQPEISKIVASTEIENVASFKVLEKNHFIKKEMDDPILYHWELLISSIDHV